MLRWINYNEDSVIFWLCAGKHIGKILIATREGDSPSVTGASNRLGQLHWLLEGVNKLDIIQVPICDVFPIPVEQHMDYLFGVAKVATDTGIFSADPVVFAHSGQINLGSGRGFVFITIRIVDRCH